MPLGLSVLTCLLMASTGLQAQRQVAALGRIVPGEGLVEVAAPAGATGQAIVAELKVKVGDAVKAGDTLATLTSAPLLQAAVTAAEKEAAAAAEGVSIAQQQAGVFTQRLAVLEARQAVAAQEASAAQIAVEQAEAQLAQAKSDYLAGVQRLQGEIDEHTRVIKEWDPGKSDRVEIEFQQAVLRLEMNKLHATFPAQQKILETQVKAAQADAKTASDQLGIIAAERAGIEAEQAIAQAQIKQVQAQADAAAAQVAQAKAQLAQATVKAPLAGTVLAINARPGEAVGMEGLLSLADTSEMYVEAEVYIDDIALVKVGQAATISGQPLSGELTGKVSRVASRVAPNDLFSRDPTAFADKRVVMVRVKFDDPTAVRSLIGAQVTVKIQP